jgi:rhodanese-related sulfurtransferase
MKTKHFYLNAVMLSLALAPFVEAPLAVAQTAALPAADKKLGAEIGATIAKEDQITIDLFKQIQASEAALASIVLVDARSEKETSVSVIPGAITKAQYEADAKKYAGRTVVCYCLSGGRSGKFVKQLKAKDIPAVDLKGSIIGWCEARMPLATLDGKPTKRVNVYGNAVPAEYESVE